MYEFYVNLHCEKCNRSASRIIKGKIGEKRTIGCKECNLSTVICLENSVKEKIGYLSIQSGYYYPYDC